MGDLPPIPSAIYDFILWTFSILVDLFFREVHPRGSWKIPRRGPVIFVAAPHANQFVDSLILMRTLRLEAHRRVAFLIAESSMRRKFIGFWARALGAIPVARAMDSARPATGKIYLPDAVNDPCLVKGVSTRFLSDKTQVGGLLILPSAGGAAASAEILEICNEEEIRLKKGFQGPEAMKMLTGRDDVDNDGNFIDGKTGVVPGFEGVTFKMAPKVDQTRVYNAVFDRLNAGGSVGIFPEGGSHDRTELLPLKAGVAIMALGALSANPDCGLKIVPCGMNYFHAHKFRSRAVIEFGPPVDVDPKLVEMYKKGERREAVRQLLENVYQSLVAVTVTSPDFDTLMLIQAARRLYNPTHKKLPLPMVVELNRRLVKGYTHYKNDPRIAGLMISVREYNKQLRLLNLRDHQVEYAKFSILKVVFTLLYRLGKLAILAIGTLPGLILFAPVFVATKIISTKKSRQALAASSVKIQGKDVMATWKLLVALAFAPILYTFYTVLITWWTYRNRVWGIVPTWVPLWAVVISGYIIFPAMTFAALRIGEIGMDIFKSLRPLTLSLNPSSANTLSKLREKRAQLSKDVTEVINTLGPEMFPDFESSRIVADPFRDGSSQMSPIPRRGSDAEGEDPSTEVSPIDGQPGRMSSNLPRNESFGNLSSIGLFSTRPPSRSRSRSSSSGGMFGSGGFQLKSFAAIDSKAGFDEVSKKIRGAMAERGKERTRRRSQEQIEYDDSEESDESETETKKDI
ncbi:MAG: hypothetical protein M1829_006676 [Trizodia sp. TS-e1964]|nr:MAG: hypothetical protein M1829_006676 [Trizodia sp. TS-e1964]